MIFDGKVFAREIEATLRQRLRSGVRVPKVVSILVGDDPASALYTKLKKAAAERVGIDFEIEKIDSRFQIPALKQRINKIVSDLSVTGVMVQLPIPGLSREETEQIVATIPLEKDVDGLRWEESGVMPATVRAILSILDKITLDSRFQIPDSRVVVVGGTGAVGRPLVHWLKQKYGVEVVVANSQTENLGEVTRGADVLISVVGKAGLITGEMVKPGAVVVDVGMSQDNNQAPIINNQTNTGASPRSGVVGDMTNEVYQKASVAVPVPGGVGPVTVASLMANAVEMYTNHK